MEQIYTHPCTHHQRICIHMHNDLPNGGSPLNSWFLSKLNDLLHPGALTSGEPELDQRLSNCRAAAGPRRNRLRLSTRHARAYYARITQAMDQEAA